jgi:hypothetical protein
VVRKRVHTKMKKTMRIIAAFAFSATLALTLIAGGGDAYAKSRAAGGSQHKPTGDVTITITLDPGASDSVIDLGITWE